MQQQIPQQYEKQFLTVETIHTPDGIIKPVAFYWGNGKRIEIDKAGDPVPRSALKVGGFGLRYTCMIMGKERYLFLEEAIDPETNKEITRWFVEKKPPSKED